MKEVGLGRPAQPYRGDDFASRAPGRVLRVISSRLGRGELRYQPLEMLPALPLQLPGGGCPVLAPPSPPPPICPRLFANPMDMNESTETMGLMLVLQGEL
jgi:hypothetical protein